MEGSPSLTAAAERTAMASINAKLGKRGRAYLDSRPIDNLTSFLDAFQGFYAAEGGYAREDGASMMKKTRTLHMSTCFTYWKPGHKSADCWQTRGRKTPALSNQHLQNTTIVANKVFLSLPASHVANQDTSQLCAQTMLTNPKLLKVSQ